MALVIVVLLAGLVFAHELGHFLAARLLGVGVLEFGIGFPPRIWSRVASGTRYVIGAIPFGGYVQLYGEEEGKDAERRTVRGVRFSEAALARQLLIVFAGVIANFLIGFVLISLLFMSGLPVPISQRDEAGIVDAQLIIGSVRPLSPAEAAGFRPGDEIVYVADESGTLSLPGVEEFQLFVRQSLGPIAIGYRSGDTLTKTIIVSPTTSSGVRIIGVTLDLVGSAYYPVGKAMSQGLATTLELTASMYQSFADLILGLFNQGKSALTGVVGPVGLVASASRLGSEGFRSIGWLLAVISLNLAVLNSLPFPLLDGGRALFIVSGRIVGKRMMRRIEPALHVAAFILLIGLMITITYQDIANL